MIHALRCQAHRVAHQEPLTARRGRIHRRQPLPPRGSFPLPRHFRLFYSHYGYATRQCPGFGVVARAVAKHHPGALRTVPHLRSLPVSSMLPVPLLLLLLPAQPQPQLLRLPPQTLRSSLPLTTLVSILVLLQSPVLSRLWSTQELVALLMALPPWRPSPTTTLIVRPPQRLRREAPRGD